MAHSNSIETRTIPFARVRATWSGFLKILTETPGCMRCAREAERLSRLSDEELARHGLKRDEILDRAFRVYRGLNHAFDPGIREVQIVAAQADLMGASSRTGQPRVLRSVSSRDGFGNALVGLSDGMRGEPFGNEWRLNHVDIRVHFDVPGSRPAKVTVKVKPPASAIFKRHRFEDRIMTLLRRNGLVHDRFADRAAIAAE